MKKYHAILLAAFAGFALPACHKNPSAAAPQAPQAPAVPVEAKMRAAYGFAAQMPSSMEAYTAFYNLGQFWKDAKHSKTLAAIKANPLFAQVFSGPGLAQTKAQINANPDAVQAKAIVKDALGSEMFVAFAQGSGAKLQAWLRVSGAMRIANFHQAFAGGKQNDPGAVIQAVLPFVKDLDIPPVIAGFKLTSQKAALDADLAKMEQALPPTVETGSFTLGANNPFKFVAVVAGKVLTADQQAQLKVFVMMSVKDQQKAEELSQELLARRIEIAYGHVGDYFVISIGPDHAHLKLAADYAGSLLARPDVQAAANFTGKPMLAFSWTSAELANACQQQFSLMDYYRAANETITRMLSQGDQLKLETDIKRLDDEMNGVIHREFTPMTSVVYREHGLHGESFGGIKRGSPGAPMKFAGVPNDTTFLWTDVVGDQATADAGRVWFEDLCSTGYDTFTRIGLPMMKDEEKAQFQMFQQTMLPKITEFYHITRDQFSKGLGLEHAFAMDLGGEFPATPMLPPDLHANGKMIRLAYLGDVRDRALLAQSWDSYAKLTTDALQTIPNAGMLAMMVQPPVHETVNGVSFSYFKLPMDLGDFVPNVAVSDKAFVAGTSRSYSLDLSKAAGQSAPGKPMVLDFRLNMKAVYDFTSRWVDIAAKDPGLYFKNDPVKIANFLKSHDGIVSLIQTLRAFDGITVQSWEENGVTRVSSEIRWDEK